jgi:hypothetical protein
MVGMMAGQFRGPGGGGGSRTRSGPGHPLPSSPCKAKIGEGKEAATTARGFQQSLRRKRGCGGAVGGSSDDEEDEI